MNTINAWLEQLRFFYSDTTLDQVDAQLLWFFGGVMSAFCLGAFSMIIRATKAASREIDL